MTSAEELAGRFRLDGVKFIESGHGLVKARLSRRGVTAELYLQGGQVTGWRPAGTRPVIFTSAHAVYAPGKAIRGGIPVIFPWFGPHPGASAAPQHGFARTAPWRLDSVAEDGPDAVTLSLSLATDRGTSPWWPEASVATLAVTFGRDLRLDLSVENRSAHPILFEEALHTYFAVSDIGAVAVTGLEDCGFVDKTAAGQQRPPAHAPLVLAKETDSVYRDTPARAVVHDPGWGRRIVVAKTGAASTIVWNPWAEKAAAMADLGADQWQGMICVETGNVGDNRIRLEEGTVHRMSTRVAVEAAA
jgi:glucose-6-phosphate 1-epimerase